MTSPTSPVIGRVVDGASRLLERLGVEIGPSLAADRIRELARARAGVTAGTEEPRARAALEVLAPSLRQEAALSVSGRAWVHRQLLKLLERRLRLEQDLRDHPEIGTVALERPLVIVGMPRSGTTFLQNLLTLLPGSRWLRPWELQEPWPDGPGTGTEAGDPRAHSHRRLLERRKRLFPHLHRQHPFDSPAECNDLFMTLFHSNRFSVFWRTPAYARWLDERSATEWRTAYTHYRRQLQRLLWYVPGDRWVLKSPHHLGHLETLLEVLPDARCIHLHRDPREVMASLCNHVVALRRLSSRRVDRAEVGRSLLESLGRTAARGTEARVGMEERCPGGLGGGRIHDMAFSDLVRDPVGAVTEALGALGEPQAAGFEDRIRTRLDASPRTTSAGRRIGLSDFSLDGIQVEQAFAPYLERFGDLC